jgi:transcriptional regulator GlxA family with amidase domain
VRWVDAGEVVTSGGLSSGIAMALHLVERFAGRDLALRTARQIEYEWDPEPAPAKMNRL